MISFEDRNFFNFFFPFQLPVQLDVITVFSLSQPERKKTIEIEGKKASRLHHLFGEREKENLIQS